MYQPDSYVPGSGSWQQHRQHPTYLPGNQGNRQRPFISYNQFWHHGYPQHPMQWMPQAPNGSQSSLLRSHQPNNNAASSVVTNLDKDNHLKATNSRHPPSCVPLKDIPIDSSNSKASSTENRSSQGNQSINVATASVIDKDDIEIKRKTVLVKYFGGANQNLSKLCEDHGINFRSVNSIINRDEALPEFKQHLSSDSVQRMAIKYIKKNIYPNIDIDSSTLHNKSNDVICCSLCSGAVSKHAKFDPSFLLGRFDFSGGAWHAKKCHRSSPVCEDTLKKHGGWSFKGDIIQCPACLGANYRIEKELEQAPHQNGSKERLKSEVKYLYKQAVSDGCVDSLDKNDDFSNAMKKLRVDGVTKVLLDSAKSGGKLLVQLCEDCNSTTIKRDREDNHSRCNACYQRARNAKVREERRSSGNKKRRNGM